MGREVVMPKLGMTMEKGKIVKWHAAIGDMIEKGDCLAEVETDKVTLEIESLHEGFLLKVYAQVGDEVPVNEPIAFIGVQGEEFKRSGIHLFTGVGVKNIFKDSNTHQIKLADGQAVCAEKVLLAVGRKPEMSAYENLGLKTSDKGYIAVDEKMRTSLENVLAIGDITGNVQLAHVASAQGVAAVENLFGSENKMNYDVVPNCIFTYPEIASVGLTEEQGKAKNIPYKTARFPFTASGKALAMGNTKGFVKIIADSRWHEILGVHIIGPEAANLIAEAALAMKLESTAQELARTIHAHPTLSEALMEAALDLEGEAIHL